MTQDATQVLVRALQSGDGAATEALFARYLPRVGRMVALQLGVPRHALPAEAEDIVQDAIVQIERGIVVLEHDFLPTK